MPEEILSIRNLSVRLGRGKRDFVSVLDHISLSLKRGHILALTGNSGAGKSMLCHTILGLKYFCAARYEHTGEIVFQGIDLLKTSDEDMLHIYRKDIAFIPQNPLMIFDPLRTVEQHMMQVLRICLNLDHDAAARRLGNALEKAGLVHQVYMLSCRPSMLSRGTLQRLALALCLAKNPKIIIADEATSALDSISSAQLLHFLRAFCTNENTSCLLVTHHLGIATQFADRIAIIDHGNICEENSIQEFLDHPRHEKSQTLLKQMRLLYPCDDIDIKSKSY